ncbi:MAG: hypothetical protein LBL66_07190, partial [Clostridiales bacterium]|nr:hypothetical protein [Clostridiales bacterium]
GRFGDNAASDGIFTAALRFLEAYARGGAVIEHLYTDRGRDAPAKKRLLKRYLSLLLAALCESCGTSGALRGYEKRLLNGAGKLLDAEERETVADMFERLYSLTERGRDMS